MSTAVSLPIPRTVSKTVSVDPSYCAIYIRNLVKRYNKYGPPTLRNLDMNVKRGSIYSLLGSSGCGKTTILSCIVGLSRWDSGELLVLNERPGNHLATRLGYMPQDLSLYDQLSTYETIQFYGKLYKISNAKVKESWELLKNLLQFPNDSKLIKDMSGGQRRRASLALALIHNPELLILDEPTVGLDPLLREKIWNHLYKIVKTMNTTIIITTHYIEEARFSDTIGVMRRGRIIAEESPQTLLEIYNCDLLEEVVTRLCRHDEKISKSQNNNKSPTEIVPTTFGKVNENTFRTAAQANNSRLVSFKRVRNFDSENNELPEKIQSQSSVERSQASSVGTSLASSGCSDIYHSLQRMYGFTVIMVLTFLRHPVFLVVLMIMPTIQCCLALAAIGSRVKNMHFGLVNHELVNWSTECKLHNDSEQTCDIFSFTCGFVNKLQDDDLLILDSFETEQQALEQVHKGKSFGYMFMSANYSQHLTNLVAQKYFASNETLEGSRIKLRLDHSEYFTTFFIIKHIYNSYFNYTAQLAGSCGISPAELQLPYQYRPAIYGDYSDDFTTFMVPGDLLMALYVLTCLLTALIFVSDYKQGTHARARVAGITLTDIFAGHFVIQSVITLVQIAVVTAVLYFLFGYTIRGFQSQVLYLIFCYLTGIIATPMGLLMGVVFREEVGTLVFGMFLFPIFIMLGGVCFPTVTTTWFWQQVGYIIPVKVPIVSLRYALTAQLGFTHPLVWYGFVASIIWILIFVIACIAVFKLLKL